MKICCMAIGLLVTLSSIANASLLEVAVDTDKDVYQLGETVTVYVSLHNPTGEAVAINCVYPIADYLMDNTFYWHHNKIFPLGLHPITIQAEETKTWQLAHEIKENAYYFLSVGNHSVQGLVNSNLTNGQLSEPAKFQVVPEPATMLLLGLGGLLLKKKNKHN